MPRYCVYTCLASVHKSQTHTVPYTPAVTSLARFLCRDLDYFWDSVPTYVLTDAVAKKL